MRALSVAAVLIGFAAPAAYAGESTDRTYPKASCTDRYSSGAECVIQDGPPRRNAFGPNTPPVAQPGTVVPPPSSPNPPSGSGVSILGK